MASAGAMCADVVDRCRGEAVARALDCVLVSATTRAISTASDLRVPRVHARPQLRAT